VSKSRGPARLGGVALATALLLSGCAGLHPGTAIQVGDEQITESELDEVTTSYCEAASDSLAQQAQSVPNGFFRTGIAGLLAMREVAEQVASEQGVEVGPEDYQQQLGELRSQIAALPEDHQEAVLTVETARLYTEAAQAAVGEAVLGGEAAPEELAAAGAEEMQRWIEDNGVEFDPALNVVMRDGQPAPADQSLSFAVSEGAKAGQEEQPNSAIAAELPDTQRCGR
jgi:hypothetical protein